MKDDRYTLELTRLEFVRLIDDTTARVIAGGRHMRPEWLEGLNKVAQQANSCAVGTYTNGCPITLAGFFNDYAVEDVLAEWAYEFDCRVMDLEESGTTCRIEVVG